MWNEVTEHGHPMLVKTFEFDSFKAALDFVMQVDDLAEAQDHHPDILIEYNRVTIRSWTHSSGAVTTKDHHLAEAIEQL